MNKDVSYFFKKISLIFLTLCLGACSDVKNISYFQNIGTVDSTNLKLAGFVEPTIQADDILAISIFAIDPNSGAQVNQIALLGEQNPGSSGSSSQSAINGFLVDKNGEVDLSTIGKVKLLGLTTFQAKETIREKAGAYFKNPSVQVRFANFKVTVIGEVLHPAVYIMPNEKVSVIDAIGLAGDLTLYGKRENILVIREKDGKKEYARLNLHDTGIFNSPFYYLRQNDIVYIEPHKSKTAALNAPTRTSIGIILSAVSVLVLALARL